MGHNGDYNMLLRTPRECLGVGYNTSLMDLSPMTAETTFRSESSRSVVRQSSSCMSTSLSGPGGISLSGPRGAASDEQNIAAAQIALDYWRDSKEKRDAVPSKRVSRQKAMQPHTHPVARSVSPKSNYNAILKKDTSEMLKKERSLRRNKDPVIAAKTFLSQQNEIKKHYSELLKVGKKAAAGNVQSGMRREALATAATSPHAKKLLEIHSKVAHLATPPKKNTNTASQQAKKIKEEKHVSLAQTGALDWFEPHKYKEGRQSDTLHAKFKQQEVAVVAENIQAQTELQVFSEAEAQAEAQAEEEARAQHAWSFSKTQVENIQRTVEVAAKGPSHQEVPTDIAAQMEQVQNVHEQRDETEGAGGWSVDEECEDAVAPNEMQITDMWNWGEDSADLTAITDTLVRHTRDVPVDSLGQKLPLAKHPRSTPLSPEQAKAAGKALWSALEAGKQETEASDTAVVTIGLDESDGLTESLEQREVPQASPETERPKSISPTALQLLAEQSFSDSVAFPLEVLAAELVSMEHVYTKPSLPCDDAVSLRSSSGSLSRAQDECTFKSIKFEVPSSFKDDEEVPLVSSKRKVGSPFDEVMRSLTRKKQPEEATLGSRSKLLQEAPASPHAPSPILVPSPHPPPSSVSIDTEAWLDAPWTAESPRNNLAVVSLDTQREDFKTCVPSPIPVIDSPASVVANHSQVQGTSLLLHEQEGSTVSTARDFASPMVSPRAHRSTSPAPYTNLCDVLHGSTSPMPHIVDGSTSPMPHAAARGSTSPVARSTVHVSASPISQSVAHGSTSPMPRPMAHCSTSPMPVTHGSTSPMPRTMAHGSTSPMPRPVTHGSTSPMPRPVAHGSTSPIPRSMTHGSTSPMPRSMIHGSTSPMPRPVAHGSTSPIPRSVTHGSTSPMPRNVCNNATSPIHPATTHGGTSPVLQYTHCGTSPLLKSVSHGSTSPMLQQMVNSGTSPLIFSNEAGTSPILEMQHAEAGTSPVYADSSPAQAVVRTPELPSVSPIKHPMRDVLDVSQVSNSDIGDSEYSKAEGAQDDYWDPRQAVTMADAVTGSTLQLQGTANTNTDAVSRFDKLTSPYAAVHSSPVTVEDEALEQLKQMSPFMAVHHILHREVHTPLEHYLTNDFSTVESPPEKRPTPVPLFAGAPQAPPTPISLMPDNETTPVRTPRKVPRQLRVPKPLPSSVASSLVRRSPQGLPEPDYRIELAECFARRVQELQAHRLLRSGFRRLRRLARFQRLNRRKVCLSAAFHSWRLCSAAQGNRRCLHIWWKKWQRSVAMSHTKALFQQWRAASRGCFDVRKADDFCKVRALRKIKRVAIARSALRTKVERVRLLGESCVISKYFIKWKSIVILHKRPSHRQSGRHLVRLNDLLKSELEKEVHIRTQVESRLKQLEQKEQQQIVVKPHSAARTKRKKKDTVGRQLFAPEASPQNQLHEYLSGELRAATKRMPKIKTPSELATAMHDFVSSLPQ